MVPFVFQSTPPIRVATDIHAVLLSGKMISIHATHTGGDSDAVVLHPVIRISIHATHTGGDAVQLRIRKLEFISIHATHTGGDDRCAAALEEK